MLENVLCSFPVTGRNVDFLLYCGPGVWQFTSFNSNLYCLHWQHRCFFLLSPPAMMWLKKQITSHYQNITVSEIICMDSCRGEYSSHCNCKQTPKSLFTHRWTLVTLWWRQYVHLKHFFHWGIALSPICPLWMYLLCNALQQCLLLWGRGGN